MADKPLWQPSTAAIKQANLTQFIEKISNDSQAPISSYEDLYQFSLENPSDFWRSVWDFCGVEGKNKSDRVLVDADQIEKAQFFPDANLNYAENLLRRRDNDIAISFYGEDQTYQKLTFLEIYQQTASIAKKFLDWGIRPGDRIAGYLPNMPQTVIAMLAAASIGAVWSSCSPDFGIQGVVDRFSQIHPKVLLIADGYVYGGKIFSCLDRLDPIRSQLPSIEHVIIVPYGRPINAMDNHDLPTSINIWDNILKESTAQTIDFAQLPFNHPLFILFSSGTTGVPKCIVHGAGGTLLQHLKEHQLHCDIKPGDKVFYYTTCGWMMWNWLVSALASRASIVLYDGSPFFPDPEILFDIADREGITLFGTSAKYIDSLAKNGCQPLNNHPLSRLRMITSTGSPLAPESFQYVYQSIKQDVCLASISGGTDIISCFVLGNPTRPVWAGEAQTRGLGMAVDVFDEAGNPLIGKKGELVCTQPFPSQPLGFWNDQNGQKYHTAYFSRFPNVWHHGDFVELTPHGGMIIHGRSDTVLNPGGVRIGTAEIYRQVEKIPEILESLAIGQSWEHDERVILFVHLKEGALLTNDLIKKIKTTIRQNTSPRHVPAKIIAVMDIPRTKNGKLAERAVRDLIHGEIPKNQESLANPEALQQYKNLSELNEE
jgi:acetoacetyl-CoA synthetase